MHALAGPHVRVAPSASIASCVAALFVDEFDRDVALVSIPRPEIQLIVRFGPSARSGLDVHALGVRPRAYRKLIRGGQRTLTARLHLGAARAVLGVPASELAGRTVALEALWGDAATRRLVDRLATARAVDAAAIMDGAIAERLATVDAGRGHAQLVLAAAERLATTSVNAVAVELGMSERHLRRVFHDAVGVNPKAFARLARFHRALRAAREDRGASWARIATATGYYDQAHLIDEFRTLAGVTPRALLAELDAAPRARSSARRVLHDAA